jgi:hypothetical protein
MRPLPKISFLIAWAALAAIVTAQPQYQIFDIGVVQVGDTASQSFGVSPLGVVGGRSFRSGGAQAFTWTQGGGTVGLPNLAGRSFAVANSALDTDAGTIVGTAATTAFGSGRLPVIWHGGVVSQLPLPGGETLGDANDINASQTVVGSVNGGSSQRGVIYSGGSATVITQTTANGSFFVTAFGINDSGRIVGQGIDPTNAARNVGIVYDMGSPLAFEVGALPGHNGALAFGVSNNGHVVGSSMMNQGSGLPFIWSDANGMVAIPLATGTSQGSARGVNSAGWVVGQDSSAFSIPFLWDGTTTYRLADLIQTGFGWDLATNTSSSALGINDNGVIVGTGVHNGETRAYAMVPVTVTPTPTPTATPNPCVAIFLQENFDGETPPALPVDWVSSFTPGAANCTPTGLCALGTNWTTSATNPFSPPNCAFHNAPSCVTDSALDTPSFFFGASGGPASGSFMTFFHSYDLESGFDGAVLEISINGGAFTDIVAAGGTIGPPYNGTISAGTLNPMAGRPAWTGNSGGYVSAFVTFPPAASHQNIRMRFRVATDCQNAGTGWRIDSIRVEYLVPCPTPTIPPPSPTATATATATASPPPASPTPTPTPSPTPTATPSPAPPTQALNLSTRLRVQTGDNAGIGGFIITGNAPKYLLFRGIGPSLTGLGIAGALANPTLDLRRPDGTGILANNDWRDTQETEIAATGIPPTDNLEAAIVQTLDPGSYTVILRGMGTTTGIGLVEIYDLDPVPISKLANISTRAFVETGANIVIAGFIVGGTSGSDRMALRGIGPSLVTLGLSNTLADPTLELRDGNGALLRGNNNWEDDPAQAAELTAAGLALSNQLESGIAMTLSPGAYTALLAGLNNGSGVGLVEVYDLGAPP